MENAFIPGNASADFGNESAFSNDDNDNTNMFTDPISAELLESIRHVTRSLGITFALIGIAANGINLWTFASMGFSESVTLSFFALALADLLACLSSLLANVSGLVEFFERQYQLWFYFPPLLMALYFECCRRIFTVSSVLIIVYLAVQRCLCVMIPFRVKGMFTTFKTCCVIIGIVTFSTTCYGLLMWRYQLVEILETSTNTSKLTFSIMPGSEPYYFLTEIFLAIILNITYMTIMVVCLIVMFVKLSETHRFRQTMSSGVDLAGSKNLPNQGAAKKNIPSRETQALKQVSLISVIFVLTNLPFLAFGIMGTLIEDFRVTGAYQNLYRLVAIIKLLTETFNSSINLAVYYNFNTKFRQLCPLQL